jgi:hypothetical protein
LLNAAAALRGFDFWLEFIFNTFSPSGYLVQGSNGEFKLMKDEERVEMVKRARQFITKDKLLLAGSACECELFRHNWVHGSAKI